MLFLPFLLALTPLIYTAKVPEYHHHLDYALRRARQDLDQALPATLRKVLLTPSLTSTASPTQRRAWTSRVKKSSLINEILFNVSTIESDVVKTALQVGQLRFLRTTKVMSWNMTRHERMPGADKQWVSVFHDKVTAPAFRLLRTRWMQRLPEALTDATITLVAGGMSERLRKQRKTLAALYQANLAKVVYPICSKLAEVMRKQFTIKQMEAWVRAQLQ